MAKMQKATLDPAKISGYCGRLKCCLRYEDKTYTELKKNLPHRNSRAKTCQGNCRVIDSQILTQLITVEYDSGKREALPLEDVEILAPVAAANKKNNNADKNRKQNKPDDKTMQNNKQDSEEKKEQ